MEDPNPSAEQPVTPVEESTALEVRSRELEHHPTVTTTHADRLAKDFIAAIDRLTEGIAQLEMPHPAVRRSARGARTVPPEFIDSMTFIVRHNAQLRQLNTFDPDQAEAMRQFNTAFRPVADRVAHLYDTINAAMEANKAAIAYRALTTFRIARALAHNTGSLELHAYLDNLDRDLGRKGKRRKKPVVKAE